VIAGVLERMPSRDTAGNCKHVKLFCHREIHCMKRRIVFYYKEKYGKGNTKD
jgi:hypothetical protein